MTPTGPQADSSIYTSQIIRCTGHTDTYTGTSMLTHLHGSTLLGIVRWRLLVGVRSRVGGVLPRVAWLWGVLLGGVGRLCCVLLGGVGGYGGLGGVGGPASLGLPWWREKNILSH